jgi:hypothetical protein
MFEPNEDSRGLTFFRKILWCHEHPSSERVLPCPQTGYAKLIGTPNGYTGQQGSRQRCRRAKQNRFHYITSEPEDGNIANSRSVLVAIYSNKRWSPKMILKNESWFNVMCTVLCFPVLTHLLYLWHELATSFWVTASQTAHKLSRYKPLTARCQVLSRLVGS